jgi:hypothetical protein
MERYGNEAIARADLNCRERLARDKREWEREIRSAIVFEAVERWNDRPGVRGARNQWYPGFRGRCIRR